VTYSFRHLNAAERSVTAQNGRELCQFLLALILPRLTSDEFPLTFALETWACVRLDERGGFHLQTKEIRPWRYEKKDVSRQLPHAVPQHSDGIAWCKTAKAMLEHYVQSHESCGATLDWTPTRLLDLGESGSPHNVKVLVSGDLGARKDATLSYCWGGASVLSLFEANLVRLMKHVEPEELAPVHRDTIPVARSLGIRYPWIDALCIMQDQTEDWKREAALMGQVYSHAQVCISVPDSQSAAESLQRDRPPRYTDVKVAEESSFGGELRLL